MTSCNGTAPLQIRSFRVLPLTYSMIRKSTPSVAGDIVQHHDIGMVQSGCRPGFLQEAPLAVWIGEFVARQHLNGNGSMQSGIAPDKLRPCRPRR
jgi:hypothetical protein